MAAVALVFCSVALLLCVGEAGAPLGNAITSASRRAPKSDDVTIFDVLNYGAKPDGKTDNTHVAFMKTWVAACHSTGKARVVVPNKGEYKLGQVIFEGPCAGPPPIIVEVQGTLKADTDITNYETPEWFLFESITGLILTGGGTFDGQGAADWKYNDCKQNADCQLMPTNIKFNHVINGRIEGIHSLNSKAFHIMISYSQDIGAHGINITAPFDSPNTDGVHISESDSIEISRSFIGTGDDCVSIGQGSTNVTVSWTVCGPGHGISIGSLGKYNHEKDVKDIKVLNCTFLSTKNGVRVKTWPDSPPSRASGFLFQNITMNNVKNPIIIDQHYCGGRTCNPNKPSSRVQLSDIRFVNIKGTSASKVAVNIACSKQMPCQKIQLSDINLRYSGTYGSTTTSNCSNAQLSFYGVQVPPPCQ